MPPVDPLPPESLHKACDESQFDFQTTAELEPHRHVPGQERAISALELAADMPADGFNLFVLGRSGSGRHTTVGTFLETKAGAKPPADDWCYVNNFSNPKKPVALRLPAGRGRVFQQDIEQLAHDVLRTIPAAFASEDYQNRRQSMQEEFVEQQQRLFQEIQDKAKEKDIRIIETPTGFTFAPISNNTVIKPEEYEKLSDKQQEKIRKDSEELSKDLEQLMRGTPRRVRETNEAIHELNREIAFLAIGGLIDELINKYQETPEVVAHLKSVRVDIVDHVDLFLKAGAQQEARFAGGTISDDNDNPVMERYGANVLVANEDGGGAPLIYEDHPTFSNLMGCVEHRSEMGTLVTNFKLIRAGALHRANGGYLILDAAKVLTNPFSWDALKRALLSREIRIKSLGEELSLISTVTLEPDPIPLDVKIILIGERIFYYLLQAYDPEFLELFKVAADFDDELARNPETTLEFARFLSLLVDRYHLKPLNRGGVARLVEESARLTGDSEKLTLTRRITDLVREADHYATREGQDSVGREHISQAIQAHKKRASRIQERLLEDILKNVLVIDTAQSQPGQVNGLAVTQLGDYAFGFPSRITARVSVGSGKVIDIEREIELGGPIHSKGVLILSGFLAARYAPDQPLSLRASLVFEQTYGGVEGDSASAAELCALLSALAGVPIKQSLAITGSVDQYGNIQAIGGVNEKIEGFYQVCKMRGLNGEQGVLIPASNTKHMMLDEEIVAAVKSGSFHIYATKHIDQCLSLLTGMEAGVQDENGEFPEHSINHRVGARLRDFADKLQSFSKDEGKAHTRD